MILRLVRMFTLVTVCALVGGCVDIPSWEDVAPADSVAREFVAAVVAGDEETARSYMVGEKLDEDRYRDVAEGMRAAIVGMRSDSLVLREAEILNDKDGTIRRLIYEVPSAEGKVLRLEFWMKQIEGPFGVESFRFEETEF